MCACREDLKKKNSVNEHSPCTVILTGTQKITEEGSNNPERHVLCDTIPGIQTGFLIYQTENYNQAKLKPVYASDTLLIQRF